MSQKWDLRYMELAKLVGSWSKDPSRKIGAIIVGDKGQIISQGYNGFPRGIYDSEWRYTDRAVKYDYVVHAEKNAIYNAIHNSASTVGSTIYVSGLTVCHECAKAIIQVGIKRVVMDTLPCDTWEISGKKSLSFFKEVGIEFTFLNTERSSFIDDTNNFD